MIPTAAQLSEATERFRTKRASFGTVLPQVAAPMLGGYAGKVLASRLGAGDFGQTLGTIGGLTLGRVLTEPDQPAAPLASDPAQMLQMDPSSSQQDLPPWALQSAAFMRPLLKRASHNDRWQDVVLGEIPGYSAVEGYRHSGGQGAVKGLAGQVGGGVGGGMLGYGAGRLLSHFMGRDVNVPLVNMPLSHLIAGLGATVGATKGFQGALGLNR